MDKIIILIIENLTIQNSGSCMIHLMMHLVVASHCFIYKVNMNISFNWQISKERVGQSQNLQTAGLAESSTPFQRHHKWLTQNGATLRTTVRDFLVYILYSIVLLYLYIFIESLRGNQVVDDESNLTLVWLPTLVCFLISQLEKRIRGS